jgi:acyl dehydratase
MSGEAVGHHLLDAVGTRPRHSDWVEVTQDRVDGFAAATGDGQWIHTDPDRAADGPFGGTIAHGYLLLALGPDLVARVLGVPDGAGVGWEQVRFLTPVRVGARVRVGVVLESADREPGGLRCVVRVTYQVDGVRAPACIARMTLLAPDRR